MKYQGIEILKDNFVTESLPGIHIYINPKAKGFHIECELDEAVADAHNNGFEHVWVKGPSQKRLDEVISIMVERAEDEALEGGGVIQVSNVYDIFTGRLVA